MFLISYVIERVDSIAFLLVPETWQSERGFIGFCRNDQHGAQRPRAEKTYMVCRNVHISISASWFVGKLSSYLPSIHYSISKIKLAQVIFKKSFENSQIITPGCLDASCFQIWYHIISFPRKYLISFYHLLLSAYTVMPGWHITRF